jgi:hypothetical protein
MDVYEQQKMRVHVLCCISLLAERLDPLLKLLDCSSDHDPSTTTFPFYILIYCGLNIWMLEARHES